MNLSYSELRHFERPGCAVNLAILQMPGPQMYGDARKLHNLDLQTRRKTKSNQDGALGMQRVDAAQSSTRQSKDLERDVIGLALSRSCGRMQRA